MNTNNLSSLTVLRGILKDEVISAYAAYSENPESANLRGEFLQKLYMHGGESGFLSYVQKVVLHDENAFSLGCANREKLSEYVLRAYKNDLITLLNCVKNAPTGNLFAIGEMVKPFSYNADETINNLKKFYAKNGYGKFIDNYAFTYSEGELIPVQNTVKVELSDLKNYESEKKQIESNIVNFLGGLPFSDMLLYGDRGTGKSSTVHAMVNKYAKKGLRIIEADKETMLDITEIRRIIFGNPLKFIIFIDDLSLNENDDKVSALKAILEGSVAGGTSNSMIVATSNRRHIIKESFSERENSVHASDSLQENLSLSDRFGLTVMFSTTDKQDYLSIIRQLAADYKLKLSGESLDALAERWAIVKGGRSPRRARQFIELVYSSEVKKEPVDF